MHNIPRSQSFDVFVFISQAGNFGEFRKTSLHQAIETTIVFLSMAESLSHLLNKEFEFIVAGSLWMECDGERFWARDGQNCRSIYLIVPGWLLMPYAPAWTPKPIRPLLTLL